MRQIKNRKYGMGGMPLGQLLYLEDYIPEEPTRPETIWERTEGVPEWLEQVGIWAECLTAAAMTVWSFGWIWYCMVCL